MKISSEHLEQAGPAFTSDLLRLLEQHGLHDGKSQLTISSNGFKLQVKGMRDDCPEECKVCEIITPKGGGKPQLVCHCNC